MGQFGQSSPAIPRATRIISDMRWAGILNVRFGLKADKPSRAKIKLCPLWSNSGQTAVRLECPLSAISRQRTAANSALFDRLASSNNAENAVATAPFLDV
jgi:hypothetical protein